MLYIYMCKWCAGALERVLPRGKHVCSAGLVRLTGELTIWHLSERSFHVADLCAVLNAWA